MQQQGNGEVNNRKELESKERDSEDQTLNVPYTALRSVSFNENIELHEVSFSQSPSGTTLTALVEEVDQDAVMRDRSLSERVRTAVERFTVTRERRWSVSIASLVAAIPGLLMGITLAYPSNALLDLTSQDNETELAKFVFTGPQGDTLISLFAGLGPLSAVFSGPIAGWISDRWGRKWSMLLCGFPYLIGYLLLSFAHYMSTVTGFNAILLAGRSFTGLGMGWSTAVCPVYTAELSSAKLRGIYGNAFPLFITTGVLFALCLGAISGFFYFHLSLVAVGIGVVYEVLIIWFPETPRWLLRKGRVKKGECVLRWLRGRKKDIRKELDEMKKSLSEGKQNTWKLFLNRSVLIPLAYVLILFITQQAGGINAVTPFAGTILQNAGVSNPRVATILVVGVAGLVAMLVSVGLVDYSGRKFLWIVSGMGLFIATTLLGIHAFITRPALCDSLNSTMNDASEEDTMVCNPQFQGLALSGLACFTALFGLGYNSIPFILISELFPLPVRGKASGLATATLWITAGLFTGFYLQFTALVTQWFAMWIIAIINVSVVVFVIIFIPETKGKRFEELENLFVRRPDIVETVL